MKAFRFLFFAAALLLMGCTSLKSGGQAANNRQYVTGDDYDRYVKEYYQVAVDHMERYGIPASITLAQGLLESGAGKSELALKSNNHFGIKADSRWKGGYESTVDNGSLSKFRKYRNPRESYDDHSKFLTGQKRYAFLFSLKRTDYKGWAKGLKKAGYAEDPEYSQKLVSLIERYGLHRYDYYGLAAGRVVGYTNGVPYIVAEEGDRMEQLSDELGISVRKLRKYNDIKNKREPLPGEKLYIKKKKSKGAKGAEFHTTGSGESLYSISQEYGIKLMKLYELNPQYREYTKLKVGDIIRLR